jgi:hypothetical protein
MANTRVIATAGIISVAVGSVNSIAKDKKLPSAKFLIGSGVAFLCLSAIAEVDTELGNALAVAVCATVVIGEGGGVLSYINNGEMDTQKRPAKTPTVSGDHDVASPYAHGDSPHPAVPNPHAVHGNTAPVFVFPNMPVTAR